MNLPAERDRPISILVSGASGFVGRAVVDAASARGIIVGSLVRRAEGGGYIAGNATQAAPDGWRRVDAIVHCAGRAHVMHDAAADALAAFRASNVEGTLALARQALAAGVPRFIFLSSIKVNGEQTSPGAPFHAHDAAQPSDPYGVSKQEAEAGLRELAALTGLEVVIIRPVLVYGPGAKGNFLALMRALERRVPLPFRLVDNRRSLVGLHNLVDLILTSLTHPRAGGQTFLVSDGEDLSTPDLLRRTAAALGTTALLLPAPPVLVRVLAALVGKQAAVARLLGSLQVDMSHTRTTLDWTPPNSVDEELGRAARHFLARNGVLATQA